MTEVAAYTLQVQNVARHAFAELVERASACDRIRGVLALIKRHENLFRLPTRIRHATERGLYDQVTRHKHCALRCTLASMRRLRLFTIWDQLLP